MNAIKYKMFPAHQYLLFIFAYTSNICKCMHLIMCICCSGTVYGCGLNNCYQLGGTLTSNCLSPKVVSKLVQLMVGHCQTKSFTEIVTKSVMVQSL